MYEKITDEDPYRVPMRIYPAVHYTMGGLWVDYNLMSTIPGLFVLGEANFSDHGANRLGASALMQGLADGYFVIPVHHRPLPRERHAPAGLDRPRRLQGGRGVGAQRASTGCSPSKGKRTARELHRELGQMLWDYVRHGPHRRRPAHARSAKIRELRDEFWQDVSIPGEPNNLNQNLEYAGRVADYLEFGELLALDALERRESCGGHFREEYQTPDDEAQRDDEHFAHVAAWEFRGVGRGARAPRRAAGVRARAPDAAELQVTTRQPAADLSRWRLSACPTCASARAVDRSDATRRRTSRPTCRSSRCSTWSTRG